MDYDQPKENTPTVTSSLYGTLPRRGKRSRRTQKKTPEEMAILLAQYAVYQAEKSEAMAILLTCRLYTKPLYLLKQLRNIWEREVHDGSFEVSSGEQSQSVPVEFLTMRRRPARRCSSARSSTQPKVYSFDFDEKPVSSILADLKQATDRLAEGIKNVDFLNGLEQSRDSGFGSFSDSIISDTDESTVSQEDDCPGYIPVTMTGLQQKVSGLIEEWLATSPSTFQDTIINKSVESFIRIITIHNPSASTWMAKLNTHLVQAAQFRQSVRRNRLKFCGDYSLFNITNNISDMVRHLTWIELTMARNLSQDELINQLLHPESSRVEDYPNWRVNCQMFNSLTSSAAFSVLQCSKTSDCVKVVNFLIDVAIGCCQSGNFNTAMAIALGLDSQPVQRLHKVWKKMEPSKINILKSIGNPSNNFQNYREMFKLTKRKMAISIPYISLLSKDIFNKTTSPKEQLDDILSRSILITKLMKEIRTSQTIIDSATLDATILKKIYSLTVRNDDDLYYLSYKLDTPQSQYEKEDLKRLKSMRKAKSQLKL